MAPFGRAGVTVSACSCIYNTDHALDDQLLLTILCKGDQDQPFVSKRCHSLPIYSYTLSRPTARTRRRTQLKPSSINHYPPSSPVTMKTPSPAAALLLLLAPSLTAAHYLFPHFIINDTVTKEFEHVREHDNGFQPSWDDGAILASPDLRCNKGAENHMGAPTPAQVVAGRDVVGFQTNLGTKIYHPGPVTASAPPPPRPVSSYADSEDPFPFPRPPC